MDEYENGMREIKKWQRRDKALTQIQVAVEMMYPHNTIIETMLSYGKPFPRASLLIDYLDVATGLIKASEIELEQDIKAGPTRVKEASQAGAEKQEEPQKKEKVQKKDERQTHNSLLYETEKLYRNSICACMNEKCFVLLPCGHLDCCEKCVRKQKFCTVCHSRIESEIKVYRA